MCFTDLPAICSGPLLPRAVLKRFVIVRDIPGISRMGDPELAGVAASSCKALIEAGLDTVQVRLIGLTAAVRGGGSHRGVLVLFLHHLG